MNGSFSSVTNFIWNVADLLRDVYKRKDYPDVILPFTVLRRLDCELLGTKENVLEVNRKYSEVLEDPSAVLMKASGHNFYNTSRYDFSKLLSDPSNIKENFFDYLNGFSPNLSEVMERFKIRERINYLAEKDLLYKVVQKFSEIDLGPGAISNHDMGYIFEELIRKFNETNNEEAGEHFTPREIIRLMVELLMSRDKEKLEKPGIITTVYDPACGTGGMLTVAKDHILGEINEKAQIELFGQEINDETYAVCKSDMIIKGENPDNIKPDSSFSHDGFSDMTFDYILSNPPFGKDWNQDRIFIEEEHERGFAGRFGAGLPRIDDGQFLFLQHMISKMHAPETGTRIAIVFNGSPLFTGDAGSGESEIRRWIIENDWLEAIVALPDQLFYNTGINTYLWILSSVKNHDRKGKVTLVDAREMFTEMKKSLGQKRKEISEKQIHEIMDLYLNLKNDDRVKIFDNEDFGYRKITVDRPLRMKFAINEEGVSKIISEKPFDKQKKGNQKVLDCGESISENIGKVVSQAIGKEFRTRSEFDTYLSGIFSDQDIRLGAAQKKTLLKIFGMRDENAEPIIDADGKIEPDPELRDTESIPLKDDIEVYFNREVKPFVPDAWINESVRDIKDGKIGKVGYEIPFNRYFYKFIPPRPLEEIDADLKKLGNEIIDLLREVTE